MRVERATVTWSGGEVSIAWNLPRDPAGAALVLAHGAGYNMNTKLLVDVSEGLAQRSVAAVRFNFPYTQAGRRFPDPQPRLEACCRAVAGAVSERFPSPFLGGKSLGGRIASHIVADGFFAAGLIFLGYPLHPPGRPERIRDRHLYGISVPMLFLQGGRDPFATPALLRGVLEKLPRARLVEIEGGDHSFKVPGRPVAEVTAELIDAVAAFVATESGGKA